MKEKSGMGPLTKGILVPSDFYQLLINFLQLSMHNSYMLISTCGKYCYVLLVNLSFMRKSRHLQNGQTF